MNPETIVLIVLKSLERRGRRMMIMTRRRRRKRKIKMRKGRRK